MKAGMADHAERTSERLLRLVTVGETPQISIGDLVAGLSDRAFGIILLLLALPISIPTVPGLSVLCGTPMLVFSIQMMLGHHRPWLPSALSRRSFSRADLDALFTKAMPYIRRFERAAKPRLEWLTRGIFEQLAGLVILVLALIIVLPTPPIVGNIPSAVATAVIAIGFIERDGLIVLLGHAVAAVAVVTTFGVMVGLIAGALKLISVWFG